MNKDCIIFLLSIFSFITVSAKDRYFKHLGVSDGLSQVCIFSIYQDEVGAVWLGTSEGLNRYNGKDVKIFRPSEGEQSLTNNEIQNLCGNKKGQMYIRSGNDLIKMELYKERFTTLRQNDVYNIFSEQDTLWVVCRDGIYYYTEEEQKLTFFAKLSKGKGQAIAVYVHNETVWAISDTHLVAISRQSPDKQEVWGVFKQGKCVSGDSAGNIWVGTWQGLYRIDADKNITHYTPGSGEKEISHNQVRCVLEDDYGCIWVGTFRGLDCYDPATGKWSHYTRYGNSPNTLSHHSILALHKDMQGNIWVGTYYGGANVFNPDKTDNHFFQAEPLQTDCLSFPVVGKMTEDDKGNVWICTEGGGLNRYHPQTGTFTRYMHQSNDPASVGSNNLKSIYYQKETNRLYIGTHFGGLYVFDLTTDKGHTLRHINGDPASLPHDIVNDIQPYKDGYAVLTQGGVAWLDPLTEKFSPLTEDAQASKLLRRRFAYETFLIDSHQRMWLAEAGGGVICIHLPSGRIERYVSDTNHPSTIGKFKIVHIFESSNGEIYFSTIGSGMFKYQEQDRSFKSYSTADKVLPSNYCYYTFESEKDHRLYLLHSKGVSVFNPHTEEVEATYHMFQQSYSQGSALFQDKSGTIYVSGTNGLALLREQLLRTPPAESYLNFDKLYVLNEEIQPNSSSAILTDILAKTSDIYLKHNQNNITIEFAPFTYRSDRNGLYEYHLEGYDNTWTQTSGTAITYTNLPPGNYTLQVRPLETKQNPHKEIRLNIHVSAPFYATVWAYLFYFLCVIAIMTAIIRFKTRQAALTSSLEFERKEKERIEEMNQIKLRFFTNISHEFRTPLTLILGQIEALMQSDKLSTSVYNRILRIYKNAWHLRNLISELLDFRKQEQGYLKLKVEERDLTAFCRQVYTSFYEYAQRKEVNYHFDYVEETIPVWFDAVQLQKVIFNLLSNAFKYTPRGGSVTLEVRRNSTQALVSVTDTGAGIPEEEIQKIFERFYQADNSSSFFRLGTGIGLALAKGIMEMHHGKIDVTSTVGRGTRFSLTLPLGNRHFTEEEMTHTDENDVFVLPDNLPAVLPFDEAEAGDEEARTLSGEETEEKSKPVILLVEDNEELLTMLSELFSPMYEVHTAHNGREGLEMTRQIHPDLIVSDIMMPGMSGKEMCYKIKNNVELSHIPVVLLTAQTSTDYIVEGFMFGADDYVTKPFNVKVLMARCNNLVKNKKRLMAHYAGKSVVETADTNAVNRRDKELLERCVAIIRENFENTEFDVMTLATQLCMGRSKLYMQFKQMTGLTPNEFILKVKLDEAMALLKNRAELNISEISVRLGFSSPRYFSKSFKAFFGVTPQSVRSASTRIT